MKRTDPKRDSSVLYIGKGIIIIGVLTISSLSFTLGYFIGKSIQHPVVNQTSVITPQESTEQKNIDPEKKEAVIQEPTQETRQTAKTQQPQQNQQTKDTEETKKTPQKRKYTVQAGVFKDASTADALKAKLDKKGYKIYIIPYETKKHEKLYKVMVGEFATRKEAEVLSIKIKNAESLQTFVTFKTEKEELR